MTSKRNRKKLENEASIVDNSIKRPIIEVVNIKVVAQEIPLKKNFKRIHRVVTFLHWVAPLILFSDFMDNGGALTNGINFNYDGELMLSDPIKINSQFSKYAYDSETVIDGTGTKQIFLSSRLSFNKFIPGGLAMGEGHSFSVILGDDLSSLGIEATLTFEGWGFYTD